MITTKLPDGEISMFQTMWYIGKIDSNGTLHVLEEGAAGSDALIRWETRYLKGENQSNNIIGIFYI